MQVFLSAGDDPKSDNFADPEAENCAEETPLCVAARQTNPDCAGIVKHLVDFKADICTKCPHPDLPTLKILPYDLARMVGNKNVMDVSSRFW